MTNLAQIEAAMVKARTKLERARQAERTAMKAYHRASDRFNTAHAGYQASVMAFEQAAHAAKQGGE